MVKIKGEIISAGIAVGTMYISGRALDIDKLFEDGNRKISSDNYLDELDIYKKASDYVRIHYLSLYEQAISHKINNMDDTIADIFEGLSMLVMDEELTQGISDAIKEELYTAEYAVYKVSRLFISSLELLEDEYIRQRAKDIEEVASKVISHIIALKDNDKEYIIGCNNDNNSLNNELSHILIVDRLLPEMLINDNLSHIVGVVAKECGLNSHGAIIARTLGVPVMCADINVNDINIDYGILDCEKGELIIAPTEDIKAIYFERIRAIEEEKNQLKKYRDIKVKLKNGQEVAICANVSSVRDVKMAIENGADGIGLFRTELLYMDCETAPTEEEQFSVYKEAVAWMKDKPLIIRTFDGGLDKPLKFMVSKDSHLRGIQLSLRYEEIFKIQLRAIYRAAVYGNIKVMFPMITTENEIARIKEILTEVKAELTVANIPFKDVEVGIMIETPSAVKISDILTKDIDFVSIGTNDLIQYSFNRDRMKDYEGEITEEEYDKLFNMIKETVDNAHENNCKVSVCGELAGDFNYTDKLLELGVDELSVTPSKILLLRKQINC